MSNFRVPITQIIRYEVDIEAESMKDAVDTAEIAIEFEGANILAGCTGKLDVDSTTVDYMSLISKD